jgi:hypothetical protein
MQLQQQLSLPMMKNRNDAHGMVDWKEISRDIMALGGIPFYFLVIGRALVGKFTPFVFQLLIAFVILLSISAINKNFNHHLARATVLVVFTSLFYNDAIYTVFAVIVLLAMLLSLLYLKTRIKAIVQSMMFGFICSGIGYYLAELLI